MIATMLLTDLVGSTRLWRRDPSAMAEAMDRHDELVARAAARYGGTVVSDRGEGDSAFVVFTEPSSAMQAACEFQLGLASPPSPLPPLTARIGIHTGETSEGYVGAEVNRCGRLRSLAHGGQILATAVAARSASADPIRLVSLGQHQLRDFGGPEEIFQVCHSALPIDFPRLSPSADAAHLAALADRLRHDIGHLPDRAPALALFGEIELLDGPERAAFLRDVQHAFEPIAARYHRGRHPSAAYRLAFACYPADLQPAANPHKEDSQ